MGAGGTPAEADIADSIAAMNVLAGGDGEAGKMAVAGRDAVAVVHHNRFAVSAEEIGESDHAVGGGNDGLAVGASDIHATVKRAFAVEWVDAFPEVSGYLAFNRPEIGSRIGSVPVSGGGIARQSQADAD